MTLDEITAKVWAYGTDSAGIFGGTEGGIRIQQNPYEYARFIHLLQDKPPKSVLEIGSAQGGNLKIIHDFFDPALIVLMDNNSHDSGAIKRVENLRGVPHVEIIANSEEAFSRAMAERFVQYDLVFIDGHHDHPYPENDFLNYGPMVRRPSGGKDRGGLLAFHDTAWADGVQRVQRHLAGRDDWKRVGEFHEGRVGITVWERLK